MIVDFLYALRARKVPVGAQEAVALAGALSKGLHDSSLDGFYHLARAVLIHSENHLDDFDIAFGQCFRGVELDARKLTEDILEWLKDIKKFRELTDEEKALIEALDPEELQTVMRRIHNMAVEVTPTLSAVFGGTLVENPEEARKGEYRTTVLEIETFPGTWVALNGATADRTWNFPESIFVITGWSPQGVDLGEWEHEKANRTIANTITDIGGRFLHGHGRSPSGDHSEPSLFAWGISDADAMEIARRANQDAIFEVTANEVTLLSCVDGSRESWSRFQ